MTKNIKSQAPYTMKPLQENPISLEFFNGEKYTAKDGVEYLGYSSVVFGEISFDENDEENYMDPKIFDKLCLEAYHRLDALIHGYMTKLGVFSSQPVTDVPTWTKDQLMRAIAAKVEQDVWNRPSNAEIKVTHTQNSGSITTNIPGKENLSVRDELNQVVVDYVHLSGVVEIAHSYFNKIQIDPDDYYTKNEIDFFLTEAMVEIRRIYTEDPSWEPENDGDATNKAYVDKGDLYLQQQINGLIAGDITLKTGTIEAELDIESYTGLAQDQKEINIEAAAITRIHTNKINELIKRAGTPLSTEKSLGQEIANVDGPTTIIDYDTVEQGTIDSLEGFNPQTGLYTIQEPSKGDLISFTVQAKITGKPTPNVNSGKMYLYKNGAPMMHPITGLPVETTFGIDLVTGVQASLNATDIPIRAEGTDGDEVKVGDVISVVVEQTLLSGQSGIPLTVSDVKFDMIYMRAVSTDILSKTTVDISTEAPTIESISGTATTQAEVNAEVKDKITDIDTSIAANTDGKINAFDGAKDLYESYFSTLVYDNAKQVIPTNFRNGDLPYSFSAVTSINAIDSNVQDNAAAIAEIQNSLDNLSEVLLPIGTILLGLIKPSFGTWEEIGILLDGQAIVGGTTTNGSVASHDHKSITSTDVRVRQGVGIETIGQTGDGALAWDDTSGSELQLGGQRTGNTGTDQYNRAWGLGVGPGVKLWKRTG